MVPLALLLALVAGAGWALVLRARNRTVYDGIGLGVSSAAASSTGFSALLNRSGQRPMTAAVTVRPVTSAHEVQVAADLIARSFDHLAANHYLVPDPERRLPVMRDFFHLLTAHAADGAGRVMLTTDHTATAVWFDRTRPTKTTSGCTAATDTPI